MNLYCLIEVIVHTENIARIDAVNILRVNLMSLLVDSKFMNNGWYTRYTVRPTAIANMNRLEIDITLRILVIFTISSTKESAKFSILSLDRDISI